MGMFDDPGTEERDDAHGFAQTAMETALGRENFRDGLEAMGGLTDAVLWLAAETRAARLDRRQEVGG